MCPLRAGIFLNFLWHRLHSTGFGSVLLVVQLEDVVVVETLVWRLETLVVVLTEEAACV